MDIKTDPNLARAIKALRLAEDRLATAAKDAQAKCKHEVVYAMKSSSYPRYMRICPKCRREEHAPWGFPAHDACAPFPSTGTFASKLNTELQIDVGADKFYAYRLP